MIHSDKIAGVVDPDLIVTSETDTKNNRPYYRQAGLIYAVVILSLVFVLWQGTALLPSWTAHTDELKLSDLGTNSSGKSDHETTEEPAPSQILQNDPSAIIRRLIDEKYPECQPDPGNKNGIINLKSQGTFVKSDRNTTYYDHVSCFVMKARYNCAYPPGSSAQMAHQYELVLHMSSSDRNGTNRSSKVPCRLASLIDDTLEAWWRRSSEDVSPQHGGGRGPTVAQFAPKHQILLQGSSFIRQVWEALVCRISQMQVTRGDRAKTPILTDLVLQDSGPGISIENLKARHGVPVSPDELGNPIRNWSHVQSQGCHGAGADISAFYRHNVTIPSTMPHCNDNIGMIEVMDQYQFSYIFRPNIYSREALERIYVDRLGIKVNRNQNGENLHGGDAPTLFWNLAQGKSQKNTLVPVKESYSMQSWHLVLKKLQRRHLGKYFGADNPLIDKPPDMHACMPGFPDDEVNLLLFQVFTGYRIE